MPDVAKKSDEPKKAKAGIGVTYSAAKSGLSLASPVTDAVAANPGNILVQIQTTVPQKLTTTPYALNALTVVADEFIDKKTGQKAALTRRSASALLPEVYLGLLAADEHEKQPTGQPVNAEARAINIRISKAHQGYNPMTNTSHRLNNPEYRVYRGLRHGGQVFRWLRGNVGIVKRITEPLAKLASNLGGSL